MRITKHLIAQATAKKIPMEAIHLTLAQRAGLNRLRTDGVGKCNRCHTTKHEWQGYGETAKGERYAVAIVVCPTCDVATTCYLAGDKGCTPIRRDQWAKGQRQYTRRCGDCGKRFTITARTWEELHAQTLHKCHGETVDLISDEHRGLSGEYNPR